MGATNPYKVISLCFFIICISAITCAAGYPDPLVEVRRYHHYDELTGLLEKFARDFPDICRLHNLGESEQGRRIWALQITDCPDEVEAGEQWVKYVGNMHGNEAVGREILVAFIEYLLEGYGTNQTTTQLVDNLNIWIVPSMNPDGFEAAQVGECCGVRGRANANEQDLNRDFTYGERVRQKETEVLIKFIEDYQFILSINFHGGALVANYPYDSRVGSITTRYAASPDDEVFKVLASAYANMHPFMWTGVDKEEGSKCGGGDYNFKATRGITNGNHWYSVEGGMQDYNYLQSNAFELTVETNTCKYPTVEELPKYFGQHRKSMISFFNMAEMGVAGFVRDARSGIGIEGAIIQVLSIAHNITSSYHGQFQRLLTNGKYQMVAHAKGYHSSDPISIAIPDSNVYDHQVNFYLYPTSDNSPPSSNLVRVVQQKSYEVLKDVDGFIDSILNQYPDLTYVYSIGQSALYKHEMRVLVISDSPREHELGEPEMKLIANIHGNEVAGVEMLASLVRLLLTNYDVNDELTRLVDSTRIHILLSANPDGRDIFLQNVGAKLDNAPANLVERTGRENGFKVDLNRDFIWNGNLNEMTQLQPETQHIIRWTVSNPAFVLGLAYHGGTQVVCYPYDNNLNRVEDIDAFQYIATQYVKTNPGMRGGYPCPKEYPSERFPGGHLSGGNWYMFEGGMQDVNYNFSNCMELTIEVSCLKAPPVSELPEYWEANRESLVSFIKSAHIGIKGFVVDSESGEHVPNCTVDVVDIGHDVSCTDQGEYWRLLVPGQYTVAVHAPGYQSSYKTITVIRGDSIPVNFTLQPHITSEDPLAAIDDIRDLPHSYQSYPDFLKFLRALSAKFPRIASLHYLGSDEDYNLLPVLSITAATAQEQVPRVALFAGTQSADQISTALAVRLALDLCLKFTSSDPKVVELLEGVVIEIVPSFYPGSLGFGSSGGCESDGLQISSTDIFFQLRTGADLSEASKASRALNFWLWQQDLAFALTFLSGFSGTIVPNGCEVDYDWLADSPSVDQSDCGTYSPQKSTPDLVQFLHSNFSLPNMAIGVGCCGKPNEIPSWSGTREFVLALFRNVSLHCTVVRVRDREKPVKSVLIEDSCGFIVNATSPNGIYQRLVTSTDVLDLRFSADSGLSDTVRVSVSSSSVQPQSASLFLNSTRHDDYSSTGSARVFMLSLFCVLLMCVVGWVVVRLMMKMGNSPKVAVPSPSPRKYQDTVFSAEDSRGLLVEDSDSSEDEFSIPKSTDKLIPQFNKARSAQKGFKMF